VEGKANFLPLFLPKSAVVSNLFLIFAGRNILNQHYEPTPTDIQHAQGGGRTGGRRKQYEFYPPPLKIFISCTAPRAQLRLTYGLAVPSGMAGPLCFRAFTSHDNSNYKYFLTKHFMRMKQKFLPIIALLLMAATGAWAQTYTVTLKEGTEDAENWKAKVGNGELQALPLTGLNGGETVTATYNGSRKVKSVKAVKKALDPAKAYLTWDADQKKQVATEIPTTAIKVENADAEVNWEAGTYVVEGKDVKINGMIKLNGDVDLIIKDGATLTADKIQGGNKNLSIYGQANQSGQLVINCTNDAISKITTLEVHSAKVTATASTSSCGGFYNITTFNVYGGSVDAKNTSSGYGISLNTGGSINIFGGEVKAEGKGTGGYGYGIRCGGTATVTVSGGKLWAGNADNKALYGINLQKGEGFTGKIETSADNSAWTEYTEAATPDSKYVRVGY